MKAAIVGYGQMGHIIERLAPEYNVEIIEKYWDEHPFGNSDEVRMALQDVEVLIDFSIPDVSLKNIKTGLSLGKQIVIGTTGWLDNLDSVKNAVHSAGTGLVYASNFSLGVNLFYRMIQNASNIMGTFEDYDPMLEEKHHQFKKDAPSGTALEIIELMKSGYPNKDIPVTSVRGGFIPGTHMITFDSQVDSIQLSHCARNREGFAKGALIAARWITGKTGVYHFSEILDEILQNSK